MQKSGFEGKFLSKLPKIDRQDIEQFLSNLVREKNFFEIIFNALDDGIVVLQPNLDVAYANNAALEMLGVQPRQKVIGERVTSLSRNREFGEVVARFAINRQRVNGAEIELDGVHPRAISVTIIPLEGDRGNASGSVIMILHDITEVRRVEEQRRRTDRAMTFTTLAAGLAHEIKNPLNSLQIHAQLLQKALATGDSKSKKPDMSRVRQSSEIVVEEIQRLNTVVNQFLTAVRPTRPMLQRAHINRVVERVAATVRPEADLRGVRLSLALDHDIPATNFDPNQMTQALLNLLRNSLDAFTLGDEDDAAGESSHTDARIEIRTELGAKEYRLRVTDNGGGIPESDLKRIFEPYFSTKFTGSGLGLAIVTRIVEEHAGHLELTSKPSIGTVVTMSFPLDQRPVRLLERSESGE